MAFFKRKTEVPMLGIWLPEKRPDYSDFVRQYAPAVKQLPKAKKVRKSRTGGRGAA